MIPEHAVPDPVGARLLGLPEGLLPLDLDEPDPLRQGWWVAVMRPQKAAPSVVILDELVAEARRSHRYPDSHTVGKYCPPSMGYSPPEKYSMSTAFCHRLRGVNMLQLLIQWTHG